MNVGRPRKADPEDVLNAAMQAFWNKGYEATSLADLVAATGLHKGSLYKIFGDKHALFLAALEKYLSDVYQCQKEALENAETPLDGLKQALFVMQDRYDEGPGEQCGCMAINSIIELAPHDQKAREILERHYQRMVGMMHETIQQIVDAGQANLKQNIESTCLSIMATMAGLASMRKNFLSTGEAKVALLEQLKLLGFTPVGINKN